MALLCQKLCQGFFQCLLPPAPAAVLAAPWGPPLSVVGAAVSAAAAVLHIFQNVYFLTKEEGREEAR
jgi:hypothetical protein